MQGRRIFTDGTSFWDGTNIFPFSQIKLGDYWIDKDGGVYGKTPIGLFCNLSAHNIIHNPQTGLSATPSILVKGVIEDEHLGFIEVTWHGHLTDGIWIPVHS